MQVCVFSEDPFLSHHYTQKQGQLATHHNIAKSLWQQQEDRFNTLLPFLASYSSTNVVKSILLYLKVCQPPASMRHLSHSTKPLPHLAYQEIYQMSVFLNVKRLQWSFAQDGALTEMQIPHLETMQINAKT